MDRAALTARLKQEARRLGFDLAGACPAVTPTGLDRLHEWLATGYAGEMRYLADRAAAYDHPRQVLDGVRSLLVVAMNYRTSDPAPVAAGQGHVSRYAWGRDYHDTIHERLKALAESLREMVPTALVRGVVDTAPLLEREFAELAGLGWIGKNTLVLNRQIGSWFFLAVLLTDAELDYDAPHAADYCGTCTACLDACPTQAFVAPYVLDSRRCISYLTIELRSTIPPELREGLGDWVFGCDVCQDVCPWNHRAPHSPLEDLQPGVGTNPLDLIAIFDLSEAEFRARFRHTPLWRAKRRGLLRNAAVVLGNQRFEQALPVLICGLGDDEPLVRGACAWAVGRLDDPRATEPLRRRLTIETDADVRGELATAIQAASAHSASSATAESGPAGA
jgi:epoxyqueuosine reductase